MIEQPLPPDDLVGHAMVQEAIRTPICLDESDHHPRAGRDGLDLQSCSTSISSRAGSAG